MIMLTKETAKQVIDSLPNDATMDDIIHALYINVKFARGEEEIREGRGVTHEEAKRKLEKWLR
jgi:predicted transcriptional regulator